MDDLTLLKDMGDRTPLPDAADLAPSRARLTAAIGRSPVAPTGGRRRRGLLLSGAAVVGLAAAITGVVAFGGLESVGVAPAEASAAEILHEAAAAARTQPDTPPRPDQFVYTRTQFGDGSIREAWLSADGTHDGIIRQNGVSIPIPGCRDGQAAVIKGEEPIPGLFEPCTPMPAHDPGLPTEAAAMSQYLTALPGGEDKTNSLGKNILSLVAENYVSSASLAALFEAVAGFDGLEVVQDAKDGAGRPGVGVTWSYGGGTTTLVFDRNTHLFLGLADSAAVVEQAAVDTAGQQP